MHTVKVIKQLTLDIVGFQLLSTINYFSLIYDEKASHNITLVGEVFYLCLLRIATIMETLKTKKIQNGLGFRRLTTYTVSSIERSFISRETKSNFDEVLVYLSHKLKYA